MQPARLKLTPTGTTGLDYKTVKLDVAARLRNTCADWSREDFEAIVEKVTMTTLKFPPPKLLRAD
jgi:hypothetical protein